MKDLTTKNKVFISILSTYLLVLLGIAFYTLFNIKFVMEYIPEHISKIMFYFGVFVIAFPILVNTTCSLFKEEKLFNIAMSIILGLSLILSSGIVYFSTFFFQVG